MEPCIMDGSMDHGSLDPWIMDESMDPRIHRSMDSWIMDESSDPGNWARHLYKSPRPPFGQGFSFIWIQEKRKWGFWSGQVNKCADSKWDESTIYTDYVQLQLTLASSDVCTLTKHTIRPAALKIAPNALWGNPVGHLIALWVHLQSTWSTQGTCKWILGIRLMHR